MKRKEFYYIMAFDTTTDAMGAEKYARERINTVIMPVPREISSGCGLALRFMEDDVAAILAFCSQPSLNGTLYKMQTKKVDGHHPIEKINLLQ